MTFSSDKDKDRTMLMEQITAFSKHFHALAGLLPVVDGFHIDCDGTLLDNEGLERARSGTVSHNYVKKTFGLSRVPGEYGHLAGTDVIIDTVQNEYGVTISPEGRAEIKETMAELRRTYIPTAEQARPIVPIAALAYFLKQHEFPHCVVTSSEQARALHFFKASEFKHFDIAKTEDWFFTSNKKNKISAHKEAQARLSEIHGREIKRVIAIEDSTGAVYEAGLSPGVIVLPHVLATNVTQAYRAARKEALQHAKFKALQETGSTEYTLTATGDMKPIETFHDVTVVMEPDDLVPALKKILSPLAQINDLERQASVSGRRRPPVASLAFSQVT